MREEGEKVEGKKRMIEEFGVLGGAKERMNKEKK